MTAIHLLGPTLSFKIKNDKIVAVHFRTKDYEIRLEEDYYRKAIEEFNNVNF